MTRSPGPPLQVAIPVLVVGFVLAVTGGIGAAVTFARSLPHSVNGLPAVVVRHLEPGSYDVYQLTGVERDNFAGTISRQLPTTLTRADVTVTEQGGDDVPVLPAERETVNFTGDVYTSVAEFSVNSTGDYTVVIRDPGSGGGEVLVARAGGDILPVPAGWLIMLGSGGFVAVVGLVLLIVGIVRRDSAGRAGRAVAAPAGPIIVPAGWYPDPGGTAHYRWWDGAKWTDHTS